MWIRIILHTIWSTTMFLTFYIFMLVRYTGQWQGSPAPIAAGATAAEAAAAKQANEDGVTAARARRWWS